VYLYPGADETAQHNRSEDLVVLLRHQIRQPASWMSLNLAPDRPHRGMSSIVAALVST